MYNRAQDFFYLFSRFTIGHYRYVSVEIRQRSGSQSALRYVSGQVHNQRWDTSAVRFTISVEIRQRSDSQPALRYVSGQVHSQRWDTSAVRFTALRYVSGQVHNQSCSYLCHLLYLFGLSCYLTENSLQVVQTSLSVIYRVFHDFRA